MKAKHRNFLRALLITGGIGLLLNLLPGQLPTRFTSNIYLILGAFVLILILLYFLEPSNKADPYPLTRHAFFGRQTEQAEVISLLSNSEITILNVHGLGGVGKSSLLGEITKDTRTLGSVIWQTAKKQFLEEDRVLKSRLSESPTFESLCNRIADHFGELTEYKALKKAYQKRELLERLLEKHRTLLVIDNFESYDEEAATFLKNLADLLEGTSSKAILTCRVKVEGIASYKVEGLNLEETADLINHELFAERKNVALPAERVKQVHNATNGLPLAVKLIAARVKKVHLGALDAILERLSNIDFNNAEDVYNQFYKFVYQEIWDDLSKDAKKLLIRASTFSLEERVNYRELQSLFFDGRENTSSDEKNNFEQAFSENIKYSLLESKEINDEVRYFLHPLTKAFVKADLLKR